MADHSHPPLVGSALWLGTDSLRWCAPCNSGWRRQIQKAASSNPTCSLGHFSRVTRWSIRTHSRRASSIRWSRLPSSLAENSCRGHLVRECQDVNG